jgi:hypothetical protein
MEPPMSDVSPPVRESFLLPPDHVLRRIQHVALIAGLIALGLCGVGACLSPAQFLRSYLVAYLFWFGIALGCMAILMIHHIAGGAWGAVIRRLLESGTRTLPLMALLFLPLALGLRSLYEWARPEAVAQDAILQHNSLYLNVPFFLARAAFYFAVWLIIALFLNRWSLDQDSTTDPAVGRRLELLSRGGLLAVGLTMTFASIDWVMSLDPRWYSTIYGILVMGGQVLGAMAFVIPMTALLARGPLSRVVTAQQFHDLGKLMLAFLMLWAYFAFSQFLIIWSANLPEEIPWYLRRMSAGWQAMSVGLILFHFILPFLVLLSRDVKRRAGTLAAVALFVLLLRFIDVFWLVTPAFSPAAFAVHWMDIVTPVGVGGIWLWVFVWQLQGRPLIAINDPSLPQPV